MTTEHGARQRIATLLISNAHMAIVHHSVPRWQHQ